MQKHRTAMLLGFNALFLLLVFLRVGRSQTVAEPTPSIPGLTVMPAQLSPNTWGCYVMDNWNQTLTVYQYSPGEHNLHLAAARDVQYDRKLKNFNTTPSPTDIQALVEKAEQPSRAAPTTQPDH